MSGDELTAVEIARLADVGRAAVSNWRKRHADFPQPVGGSANSPTFSRREVEQWLAANGRAISGQPASKPAPTGEGDDVLAQVLRSLIPDGRTILDPAGPAGLPSHRPGSAEVVACIAPQEAPPPDAPIGEFGLPGRNDVALAWVQVCLAYTPKGGTAVVAVPFSAAVRTTGRRIRAELLRAGVLRQVVGLPELPGGLWQIWVLTRPSGRPTYQVRMVDLFDRTAGQLPNSPADWDAIYADELCTRTVPSIELLDEEVLLVPSGHVAGETVDVRRHLDTARVSYARAVNGLAREAPTSTDATGAPSWPLVTVVELMRTGMVTISRGEAEPGDVLVRSEHGEFMPTVATEAVGDTAGATVLRCQPDVLDPYFLAGFLRSDVNRRHAAGTSGGTYRLDVKRARVPRMPLPDQHRYGVAFRELMAFDAAATAVAHTAQEVTRTTIQGLTNGTFAPPSREK
ncbi:hypothetical protein QLQ12_01355 [Actinoplanes sp. NEAU-A12]|uniref:Uncharacterized protein n=1 Tax=Actinoplanes sandaracinus TaxID=3045177 RepID=A0ABT6WC14_9ACTN|nr:hypothetical protein [Actinoplanes sandaracinus]MDI6097256.1 hypothetical protein [Actinoplanes sandaracinus]